MVTDDYRDRLYTNASQQDLIRLGWTAHFQAQLKNLCGDELIPARVVGVRKNAFCISNGKNEWLATAAGRLRYHPDCIYPVTGDWVLMTNTVISEVLARKNVLTRGAAGTHNNKNAQAHSDQVLAANLDTVFVVCGLDRDYNIRRIERYLTLVYNCGLNPVIILTKADLHQYPTRFANEVEHIAFGVAVHLVSALDGNSLLPLEEYLSPGQTATMIGSSGAGKSTLVNRLCGKALQATGSISDRVGKGKHTTTNRDMIMMPQGGMVIDNPGIREIAFWDDTGGIGNAFPDIEDLSGECRFSNCSHLHEPGCRVLRAAADGEISRDRLESYRKMKRELTYLSHRRRKSAGRVEKERWKEVALKIKAQKRLLKG
jgi:ribosome biogenesis GTPase / thiamine phosphate phosphatase